MKRGQTRPAFGMQSERGAAMLAALCFAIIFALCLSSYVALCYTSLRTSTRSLMSSHCIELAEAGLEHALYAQNANDWTSEPWYQVGNYSDLSLPVTLPSLPPENGETWQIKVRVTNYLTNSPIYQSWGIVSLPDGTTISREIQTAGGLASTFVNAVAATNGRVRFLQSGLLDSFNSTLGTYPSQTPGYSAVVLSESSPPLPSPTVYLNTATVNGYAVGTDSNSVSYASTARIQSPTVPNYDPNRVVANPQPYQPQFLENIPTGGATIADIVSTTTLGSPTATVPAVYNVNNVSLTGTSVLTIQGPVILVISGNLSISGSSASIDVLDKTPGQGGPYVSLEVHMKALSSAQMNIDGGGILNASSDPRRVVIEGTNPAFGTLEIGTPTDFYGVLYFPNNPLTVNSTGNIYGSLVASDITFNNSPNIHYDLALRSPTPLVSGSPSFQGPIFSSLMAYPSTPARMPVVVGNIAETVPASVPPF